MSHFQADNETIPTSNRKLKGLHFTILIFESKDKGKLMEKNSGHL